MAIANPTHAPYGQKAEEILRHYQLYDQVQAQAGAGREALARPRSTPATGAADAGLLAYSLALGPELRRAGHFYLIPASAHTPLAAKATWCLKRKPADNATATEFTHAFLATPAAQSRAQKVRLWALSGPRPAR